MIRVIMSMALAMGPVAGWGQSISIPVDDLKQDAAPAPAEGQQTEEQKAQQAVQQKKVERVEVTGSHIKRVDTEGASPVQTVTRKDLEKTGYNSVSDVLRDSTVSAFGGAREDSGSAGAGQSSIDLRGLGSDNTLVLMDGQRLPTDAITGAVDINLIPMAAVERIEILKDGASATYGSDALGGVVNIITRKDYSGTEVAISQTTPELRGGVKRDISVVNGFSTRKFNMVSVIQHRDNEISYDRDYSWNREAYSNTGLGHFRNVEYDPSDVNHENPSPTSKYVASGQCPAGMIRTGGQGDVCRFRYTDFASALPELKQTSLMSNMNYEVNSRVRMNARIGGSHKEAFWQYAPSPGTFYISNARALQMGPGGSPLPGVTPGAEDVEYNYRVVELGTRDTKILTNSYGALLGTTVDLGSGWELTTTGNHNRVNSTETGISGFALAQTISDDVENGTFNPYTGEGSIENARYQPREETISQVSSAEVKAAGPIAEMPSGPLSLAVGTIFTYSKFKDQNDDRSVNGEVFASPGASGTAEGGRDVRAAYTELNMPVTQKLELQLAARYDHYSDFGEATSPKAAFLYRPTGSLLVRGSVGTGFKAPLLQELYQAPAAGYPTFIDKVACRDHGGDYCRPQQYFSTSGGNPNLKEERSLSYNAGMVFEPNRDFNIGADVFMTKVKNVVSSIDMDDAMDANMRGIDLSSYGILIPRDSDGYLIPNQGIHAPLQNLASQEISGIDASTSYRYRQVKAGVAHSHLFFYKEEAVPGLGARNKLGERGLPPWRNTVSLSYFPGERHDLSVFANTIAGQQKYTKDEDGHGRLGNFTTMNAQYSYKTKKFGTFTVGVNNLLDTKPPLDDTVPTDAFLVNLYDQTLRSYYTAYKAAF